LRGIKGDPQTAKAGCQNQNPFRKKKPRRNATRCEKKSQKAKRKREKVPANMSVSESKIKQGVFEKKDNAQQKPRSASSLSKREGSKESYKRTEKGEMQKDNKGTI